MGFFNAYSNQRWQFTVLIWLIISHERQKIARRRALRNRGIIHGAESNPCIDSTFYRIELQKYIFVLLNTPFQALWLETKRRNWLCQFLQSHLGFRLFFCRRISYAFRLSFPLKLILEVVVDATGRKCRDRLWRIASPRRSTSSPDPMWLVPFAKPPRTRWWRPRRSTWIVSETFLTHPHSSTRSVSLRPGAVHFSTIVQRVEYIHGLYSLSASCNSANGKRCM